MGQIFGFIVISGLLVCVYELLKRDINKGKTKENKRPVEFTLTKFKETEDGGIKRLELKGKGVFHRWGAEGWEGHENLVEHTVGIIEDEFGDVHSIDPKSIKFTDKK